MAPGKNKKLRAETWRALEDLKKEVRRTRLRTPRVQCAVLSEARGGTLNPKPGEDQIHRGIQLRAAALERGCWPTLCLSGGA
eukprot:3833641-Rhodomonas_salina.1